MNCCLCPAVDLEHCCHVEHSNRVCVSQEGKSFVLECEDRFTCWVIIIDHGLLKHATYCRRCDYGLYVKEKDSAYLIELKGRKINIAIDQINQTIILLHPLLKSFTSVHARIVAYQSAPRSIKFSMTQLDKLMKREFNGDFEWTPENILADNISII